MDKIDISKKLPEEFINILQYLFNPSQVNRIFTAYKSKRKTTFRINLLKISRNDAINRLKSDNIKFNNINFINNAFFLESEDKKLLSSDMYKEGQVYLQSISSMLPPIILAPMENEKVLDIAAAPGSKTTQMAMMMNNTGFIDAVEPDFIRMERLKYNCNLLGVTNVNFFNIPGEKFFTGRESFYDKALVDAPCSGEGIINFNDKNSYANLHKISITKLANMQFKLLKSAIIAVKKGGIILYSTCTLNQVENEEVIDKILNDKEVKVSLETVNLRTVLDEIIPPFTKIKDKSYNPEIKKALRLLPSQRIEGFFICKMKKVE